ncbi:MAG: phosphoribosyltransferase family protein [Planctomycetota bacterium]
MTRLLHVSPDEFLLDTFRLGRKVYESGFRPRHVISIWRGGTPVGLGVDEFFRTRGIFLNHSTIATESYTGIRERSEVLVKGLEHLIDVVCREDGLLIVDDVLETGNTIGRILGLLRERTRANMPEEIRVATIHRKPERAECKLGVPVICLRDLPGDLWIDYPHELSDLVSPDDPEEDRIREKDEQIWSLLRAAGPPVVESLAPAGGPLLLSARELLLDSIKLGLMVARDPSFRPDFLVALWPGGISCGLPVHEVLKYEARKNQERKVPDHLSLTTARTRSSYRSQIIGVRYLADRVTREHNVLLVDTTFRSGQVINDALMHLKESLRRNLDMERVRVAAVYYNPDDRSTWTVPRYLDHPHYFVKTVGQEVIYPHSIHKLPACPDLLRSRNPELYEIVRS